MMLYGGLFNSLQKVNQIYFTNKIYFYRMDYLARKNSEFRDLALSARCFKSAISANQLFQDFKAAYKATVPEFKAHQVEDNNIIAIFKRSF